MQRAGTDAVRAEQSLARFSEAVHLAKTKKKGPAGFLMKIEARGG